MSSSKRSRSGSARSERASVSTATRAPAAHDVLEVEVEEGGGTEWRLGQVVEVTRTLTLTLTLILTLTLTLNPNPKPHSNPNPNPNPSPSPNPNPSPSPNQVVVTLSRILAQP
jgi:hypothetical protein